MGGSQSKNLTSIVNETAASVIVENIAKCSTSLGQIQNVNINQSWLFGFNSNQDATISQKCVADFQMTNEIATEIASQIQQKAESQSIAVLDLFSGSKSVNQAKISSIVSASISTKNIQEAAISVMQTQNVNVNGSIGFGVNVSQSASVVQKAIMNSVANSNLSNIIENSTSQKSSAKQTNPLAFIGDLFSGYFLFVFLIIVGILFFVYYIGSDLDSLFE